MIEPKELTPHSPPTQEYPAAGPLAKLWLIAALLYPHKAAGIVVSRHRPVALLWLIVALFIPHRPPT
jgi:hypothetical protein